ncbi:MAG: hypothetical protein ABFC67_03750 [Mizugakiibacter sp.]|uniref:hypothetical protein n=1 Tax=Mizugakiibacter sp. TaxID=1972610 RepID=UPI0031CC0FD6|nr:hypothetical protein [Xanthomonadaceae bacterium]
MRPASAPSLSSSATSSTSGTYTLSWTAVSGATRYQLNQSVNGGSASAVYNAGGQSWTSAGVGSGTYAYVVYACNVAGCSAASSQIAVTVKRIPDPPVVTAPTIATVNVAFTVSWTASSEATTYNLQGTESGTHNVTRTSYSGPNTSVVLTLGGMVDDDFQYAAQACNANGCSAWANASNSTYLQGKGGAQ